MGKQELDRDRVTSLLQSDEWEDDQTATTAATTVADSDSEEEEEDEDNPEESFEDENKYRVCETCNDKVVLLLTQNQVGWCYIYTFSYISICIYVCIYLYISEKRSDRMATIFQTFLVSHATLLKIQRKL